MAYEKNTVSLRDPALLKRLRAVCAGAAQQGRQAVQCTRLSFRVLCGDLRQRLDGHDFDVPCATKILDE